MKSSIRRRAAPVVTLAVLAAFAGCTPPGEERVSPAAMGMGGGAPPPISATLPVPRVAFLGELAAPGLRSPTRIALLPGDELVVSDATGRGVHVFSPRGVPRARLSGFQRPLAVGGGSGGAIYVGDAGDGSVRIVDRTGRELGRFGRGAAELAMPNDLAVDGTTGDVFVVDSRRDEVRVFTSAGAPLQALLSRGTAPGQVSFPTGILLDGAGGLLVADHGNARIQSFSTRGALRPAVLGGTLSALPGGLVRPQGIARDALGRVYVADAFLGRVQVFDPNGAHLAFIGDPGTGPGQLALPSDVAVDRFGRLLVTSYDTGKVLVYGLDDWVTPPPEVVRAEVRLEPRTLGATSRGPSVRVRVEVPGHDPSELVAAEAVLLAAGRRITAEPHPGLAGDHDEGDREDERGDDRGDDDPRALALRFPRRALIAALRTPGRHQVVLTVPLGSGEIAEGTASVILTGGRDGR